MLKSLIVLDNPLKLGESQWLDWHKAMPMVARATFTAEPSRDSLKTLLGGESHQGDFHSAILFSTFNEYADTTNLDHACAELA